ncbi:MAG: SDR family NAD(P)-dependent oxidoreductase [Candidatus Microthrix parvicella]|jgi:dehydrogenase/reductase SDR family protein 12
MTAGSPKEVVRRVADGILEATVIGSFTEIGPMVRSRLFGWDPPDRLDGRVVVITGGTSGIGRAMAEGAFERGATVELIGRNAERGYGIVAAMTAGLAAGQPAPRFRRCDIGDLDDVGALAADLMADHPQIDVLAHVAGAIVAERTESAQGIEATWASMVVGPFLLTELLRPRLGRAAPGRVIWMTSGGMYLRSHSDDEQWLDRPYNGTFAYAEAKRAQVDLVAEFARQWPADEVVSHATHPGWVDTPGVTEQLAAFSKVMGPILRTPAHGADTALWLAAAPEALDHSGELWLDRQIRSDVRVPGTHTSDLDRARLWAKVAQQAHSGGAA